MIKSNGTSTVTSTAALIYSRETHLTSNKSGCRKAKLVGDSINRKSDLYRNRIHSESNTLGCIVAISGVKKSRIISRTLRLSTFIIYPKLNYMHHWLPFVCHLVWLLHAVFYTTPSKSICSMLGYLLKRSVSADKKCRKSDSFRWAHKMYTESVNPFNNINATLQQRWGKYTRY